MGMYGDTVLMKYGIIYSLKEATFDGVDEVPEDIIDFNKELNSYDYGIIIDGKKYIKNIDWKKYKTATLSEFKKYHCGTCWDFANYEADWFRKHGYSFDTYFIQIDNKKDCPCHAFLIFYINGKSYYFESSWHKMQGIRKINSNQEAVNFVCKSLNETYNKDNKFKMYAFKYNTSGLDNHLTSEKYMNTIYDIGSEIRV